MKSPLLRIVTGAAVAATLCAAVLCPRWLEIQRLKNKVVSRPSPLIRPSWKDDSPGAVMAEVKEAKRAFESSAGKPGTGSVAALSVLRRISQSERPKALQQLFALQPKETGRILTSLLFSLWAEEDAPAAFGWLAENGSGQKVYHLTAAGAGAWLKHDRKACIAWLVELGTRSDGDAIWVSEALGKVDCSAFAEYWAVTGKRLGTSVSVGHNFGMTLMTGEQAGRFFDVIASAKVVNTASYLDQVGPLWVELDADGAARWLREHPNEPCSAALEKRWGSYIMRHAPDPGAAADAWLASPAGLSKEAVLRTVMEEWAGRDPGKAAVWLSSRGTGAETWKALEILTGKIVSSDSRAAFSWLETIGDASVREQSVAAVFDTWLIRDPAAASAFEPPAGWPAERVRKIRALRAIPAKPPAPDS